MCVIPNETSYGRGTRKKRYQLASFAANFFPGRIEATSKMFAVKRSIYSTIYFSWPAGSRTSLDLMTIDHNDPLNFLYATRTRPKHITTHELCDCCSNFESERKNGLPFNRIPCSANNGICISKFLTSMACATCPFSPRAGPSLFRQLAGCNQMSEARKSPRKMAAAFL